MVKFSKVELKLFLTFFLIYSLFVHWPGWIDDSNLFLTRSIVENGTLNIDSFSNQTTDRAYFDGHYYSSRPPGLSLISTPVFTLWKGTSFVFGLTANDPSDPIVSRLGNGTVVNYTHLDNFTLVSMIIITIFTSSLLAALTVILVYRTSGFFLKENKYRLLLVFVYGLGTLAFPTALVFQEHAAATFFAFLAFYLLFSMKERGEWKTNYIVYSGLLAGFASVTSYIHFFTLIAIFVYLLSFKKSKPLIIFLLSALIGLSPLIIYNYSIFSDPFTINYLFADKDLFPVFALQDPGYDTAIVRYFYELNTDNLHYFRVLLHQTFNPFRGLFFYYPILLLSLVGLALMWKEHKREVGLVVLLFFIISFITGFSLLWFAPFAFGLRYFQPLMPFLMIPLAFSLNKFKDNKKYFRIIILLALVSVSVNFIGLQPLDSDFTTIRDFSWESFFELRKDIDDFQVTVNPIYDYYLPRFLEDGSRSRIVEGVINSQIPDIRYLNGRDVTDLDFYIPFISLLVVFVILFAVWHKELLRSLRRIES